MAQKKSMKRQQLDVRDLNRKINIMANGPYGQAVKGSLKEFTERIEEYYVAHQNLFKAVAYHEAGHAVAAYTLLHKFDYVSIIPNEHSLGRVAMPKIRSSNNFNDTVVFLAGFIAEYKAFGMVGGHELDFSYIDKVVWSLTSNLEESALLLTNIADFSLSLFESVGFWDAVEALAKALLEHKELNCDTAKKIIKNAKQRARRKKKGTGGSN
jgi:Peptidase family M41